MNETNTIEDKQIYKLSIQDTVKTLQTYATQAESSYNQLQSNIDNVMKQADEWRKMQLMLLGQRQLITDLLSKTVEAPKVDETVK